MIGHIDCWFAFAQRLGLGLENMEDIILVTGCHLTRSWINIAVLGCHTDARVSFGVDVSDEGGPEVDIKWRLSPDCIRGAELSQGPNGKVCCGVTRKNNSGLSNVTRCSLELRRGSMYIHTGVPCHLYFQDIAEAPYCSG